MGNELKRYANLGRVEKGTLETARIELHWLAQVIGAVGDAFLTKANDDSQSNCAWDSATHALVGREIGDGKARLGLRLPDTELVVLEGSGAVVAIQSAKGHTLDALMKWAGDNVARVAKTQSKLPSPRGYDMPSHPAQSGASFAFAEASDALVELENGFSIATEILEQVRASDARVSEVRCWPHHFDVGAVLMLEPHRPSSEATQIGLGWSPGDGTYDEPYFYITPFPEPKELPDLKHGHWETKAFTGAIFTRSEIIQADSPEARRDNMRTFFGATLEALLNGPFGANF